MTAPGVVEPGALLARQGYAVVEGVLDPERVLDPLLDCFARRLGVRREGLAERLMELLAAGATWPGQLLDISLPLGRFPSDVPLLLEPEAYGLLADDGLLDLLGEVLGGTIWLSPVGHTRFKVPQAMAPESSGSFGHVPWHQDNGVLLAEADSVEILTVWIPLEDATVENGCLQVYPTPREGALLDHCGGKGGLAIPEALLPAAAPVPVPLRRGGVLLMHSRTVHSSLPNRTPDRVRFSMDLRYQAVEQPNGRPQFPSVLLREAGLARGSFAEWRDRWLAARAELADRQLGAFNRWDLHAPVCA